MSISTTFSGMPTRPFVSSVFTMPHRWRETARRSWPSHTLLVIGEAAKRISGALRSHLSFVPWDRVIAMRNRIAHGYDEIDFDVVVDTIRNHLPALMSELRAALEDDTP